MAQVFLNHLTKWSASFLFLLLLLSSISQTMPSVMGKCFSNTSLQLFMHSYLLKTSCPHHASFTFMFYLIFFAIVFNISLLLNSGHFFSLPLPLTQVFWQSCALPVEIPSPLPIYGVTLSELFFHFHCCLHSSVLCSGFSSSTLLLNAEVAHLFLRHLPFLLRDCIHPQRFKWWWWWSIL